MPLAVVPRGSCRRTGRPRAVRRLHYQLLTVMVSAVGHGRKGGGGGAGARQQAATMAKKKRTNDVYRSCGAYGGA